MDTVSLGSRQSGDDVSYVPYRPMCGAKTVSITVPRMGVLQWGILVGFICK